MILTVTPNAALDKTYRIDGFALDRVNRPTSESTVAGGKGINVARVYQTLGGTARATGFLAGANGRIVARALVRERIQDAFVRVRGESRICIAVIDTITGTQTEINEAGPTISPASAKRLVRIIDAELATNAFEFLVLSGSLPPGTPPGLYADLICVGKAHGVRTVLDASGEALRRGVAAVPWMVKPNRVELESIVGRSVETMTDTVAAARMLHEDGIKVVAATRGSEGAILVTEGQGWCAEAPSITFASAVASGDSFLAAFLWSWTQADADPEKALRLGVGAGAANAAVVGAGFCSRESIYSCAELTPVTRLLRTE